MMSSSELYKLYILTRKIKYFKAAVAAAEEEKQQKVERGQILRGHQRFQLCNFTDPTFNCRFSESEIRRLVYCFRLPDKIVFSEDVRLTFSGIEALCITLRRLTYPNRLGDLCQLFHRDKTQLSRIFNWTLQYLDTHFGYLLYSMDLFWLQRNYLDYFAAKIRQRGAPLTNCVGFIDGTVRPNCRPIIDQAAIYNGHKRVHALKYQSVVIPNGLVTNLFGPIPGRRHDGYLLKKSNLINNLRPKFDRGDDPPFCIYGDPAYPMTDPELLAPYKGINLTENQLLFNKAMSSVRQSVEWGFGRIVNYFAFVDFKKNLKLDLQPIALYFRIAALLTNCHDCLNGSITSDYFHVNPPTLEQYLSNNENV